MRRVDIDVEWMNVADVKRRATSEHIFLSSLRETPPGLLRQTLDNPVTALYSRTNQFIRDQGQSCEFSSVSCIVLTTRIVSNMSASPSSSFGGGLSRLTASPDHPAVGNRRINQSFSTDLNLNGVVGGYPLTSSPSLSMSSSRPGLHDGTPELTLTAHAGFGMASPHRPASVDVQQSHRGIIQNTAWPTHGSQDWDTASHPVLDYNEQFRPSVANISESAGGVPMTVNDGIQYQDNIGYYSAVAHPQLDNFYNQTQLSSGAMARDGLDCTQLPIDAVIPNQGGE